MSDYSAMTKDEKRCANDPVWAAYEIERLETSLLISTKKHELAIEEIERLRERLEMYPVKLTTGEVDRDELLSESCDGIACRDETIKLLEAEIERLEAALKEIVNRAALKETQSE